MTNRHIDSGGRKELGVETLYGCPVARLEESKSEKSAIVWFQNRDFDV